MKHPFRFWMTGSVAVVMAALGIGRGALAHERSPHSSQASRFRVLETVQRIEACAPQHGLSVFTRVCKGDGRDEFTLIVFESAAGGTPVLMEGPESRPELPLAVVVRADADGATEVLIAGETWDDLPAAVARDLTELPMLVADALR
ncbi:hypothetical protein [Piscinibacter terrae]|uniref:DUF302 domain-containing protein n=1 Tax=Piscinibacter terrae TaxID=2496871 RepID=A0A3N7JS32_9BURK|nr:hypothetical protein [Albitalea terrae]RQP23799.1 hypothetical protein DZC73_16910 [Albitalea terrae]